MSRLLVLLPSVPYPLDTGAKMRNHGLLRLLAERHQLDVLAFGDAAREQALKKLAHQARVVEPAVVRSRSRRAVDLASVPLPDMAQRLWSPTFASYVVHEPYDAVQAEGIEMARYLGAVPPRKRIYDAHNAEFLLQRRASAMAPSPLAALYSRIQWRRLQRFEAGVVRGSRMTLAVSHHDANQLLALGGPDANVRVVPNGIDTAAYPFTARRENPAAGGLLFLGKLDFRPNAEALRWFLDYVFPHVHDTRVFAVGDAPPKWLVSHGQRDDHLAVTGYVPDERRYLARCTALILPYQIGGGSRLKALIALASGLPIISTSLGMEGLEVEPGVHFLQAGSSREWVECIYRLLREPELGARIAVAGRRLVEERYDWAALRPAVEAAYSWLT